MAHNDNPKSEEHSNRDVNIFRSDLEDIDTALFNFVKESLDISTKTNKGFKKVPVIWSSAERAHNIKDDNIERDKQGMIILPTISIERSNVKKSTDKIAVPYAAIDPRGDLKGGSIQINKVIQQKKTSEFANADAMRRRSQVNAPLYRHGNKNEKIVFEIITIPIPIYVELTYKVTLISEYQEQMNDMLTPFIRVSNAHRVAIIGTNNNQYEAFINTDYGMTNTVTNYESNERRYVTDVTIDVLGYIIGNGKNEEQPRIVRRENAVQIRFARERIIVDPDEDGEFRF